MKKVLIAAIALSIFLSVLTLFAGLAVSNTEKTVDKLPSAEAVITDKILRKAVAEYEVDGKTYSVTLTTDLEPGDTITVYYNPKRPSAATTGTVGNDAEFLKKLSENKGKKLRGYGIIAGAALVILLITNNREMASARKRVATGPRMGGLDSLDGLNEDPYYWQRFYESVQYKQQGRLTSALTERMKNYSYKQHDTESGYNGLAAHDLMVLYLFQCSSGHNAYLYGSESLQDPSFEGLAKKLEKTLKYNVYHESLIFTAMLAKSYDDAEVLLKRAEECHDSKLDREIKERRSYRESCPRWFDFQRAMSFNYYSRTSEAEDKGDYSPACALMEVMLLRAEDPGYDLSYEEYLDVLDDYLVVSYKYFARMVGLLMQNGGSGMTAENELMFLLEKPLEVLSDFLPDCRPQDKKLLKTDLEPYYTVTPLTETSLFESVTAKLS